MTSAPSSFDVLVIGGGPAGLSAALALGRSRRRVLLVADGPTRNAPATINDAAVTRQAVASLERVLGKDKVQRIPPSIASEDFSYFSREVPGFFYRLGQVKPGTTSGDHHTPTFLADDGAIPVGIRTMSTVLYDYLSQQK